MRGQRTRRPPPERGVPGPAPWPWECPATRAKLALPVVAPHGPSSPRPPMKHRLPLLLTALLALVLAAPAAGAAGTGLQWQGWDSGLKDAGKSQRPVLVDVYTDWCGWCRRMERDVYSRA